MQLPRPSADHHLVLWTDVRSLAADTASLWAAALPGDERARFARIRHERGRREFLAGRLLVRLALATITDVPSSAWQFAEGPYGRPHIAGPPTSLHFNLAHSGGVVACILSDDRMAGVDVEDLDRRAMDAALWHRYCAPSEIADIEAQPAIARQRRFLTYWTLKEAYLKARGLGIAVHLADIVFTLGDGGPLIGFRESLAGTSTDWAFGLLAADATHLLSWAAPLPADGRRPTVSVAPIALAALDPFA